MLQSLLIAHSCCSFNYKFCFSQFSLNFVGTISTAGARLSHMTLTTLQTIFSSVFRSRAVEEKSRVQLYAFHCQNKWMQRNSLPSPQPLHVQNCECFCAASYSTPELIESICWICIVECDLNAWCFTTNESQRWLNRTSPRRSEWKSVCLNH